jgi:hypothetical protein
MDEDYINALLILNGIKPLPGIKPDPNKEQFTDNFGNNIVNVHTAQTCNGKCTIHNHSQHALSDKPLLWRNDRKIFEHICEHGVGHPCPDSLPKTDSGVHGCCGCCRI